ncbi:MAG TPA: hypothetical protein VFB04_02660 [Terriglobales bacterium]|nr:hypothetical protein [Terriglobales bacterium]
MPKAFNTTMVVCVLSLAAGFVSLQSGAMQSGPAATSPAKAVSGSEPAAATPVDPKPAPATPIDAKTAELGGNTWNPDWDIFIEQAVPPEMLSSRVPHDVRKFCPNFYRMSDNDKRIFWAYFFQALAGAEAGLNPTTNVRHSQMAKVDSVTKQPVHSEGLLQLTFEDEKSYGCEFDWQRDRQLPGHDPARTILQPKNNLQCGIKILTNQIIDQHRPLVTSHSYWSTLQPGTVAYRVFAKEMTNPPAACAKPARPQHLKDVTTADVHQQVEDAKAQ